MGDHMQREKYMLASGLKVCVFKMKPCGRQRGEGMELYPYDDNVQQTQDLLAAKKSS